MDIEDFRHWSKEAANWGADYRASLPDLPVRPDIQPGDISKQIEESPPEHAESMDALFADFQEKIIPGITHWQHPGFFAYFPSNAAPAAVVADYLVTAISAQCMLWQTSPAATELETKMIDWLRQAMGLPKPFTGVIQDSASSATLTAILTMRERALAFSGNKQGLTSQPRLRIYASDQVHSSIDKAIWVAGIGDENLVRVPTSGPLRSMDTEALEKAIIEDREKGYLPAGIIGCVGGTSVGATDDIAAICEVAQRQELYHHVDAAWAGSAMICEEFRDLWSGIEGADSIVFNPHKWLGAPFDCSVQFLKDPTDQIKTLSIQPEYLKTLGQSDLINYSEWTVPLGRRFRALKLWFLMRAYGLGGLRSRIRNHVKWCSDVCEGLRDTKGFEITSEPILALFSFRHVPAGMTDDEALDAHNLRLVEAINRDGRIYLTQTKLDGQTAIRFTVGQFDVTEAYVLSAVYIVREIAEKIESVSE
ncbi:MAG: pyridoxal-dependent decarboxylase [Pseudomonadota bacterium]